MGGTFWTHTIWYLVLAASSLLTYIVILLKTQDRRFSTAFLLAVVGLIYIMEHFIVVYLGAYDYHIGLTGNQTIEDLFGNVFSQVSIACTTVLLIVLKAPPVWSAVCALAYFLIETVFVSLGIYHPNWYRTWFTPVTLLLLFSVFKRWHRSVRDRRRGFLYGVTLFLGAGAVVWHLVSVPLYLAGVHYLRFGLFQDVTRDQTASNTIVFLSITAAVTALYLCKARRVWKILGVAVLLAALAVLNRMGVYIVEGGWFLAVALVNLLAMYASAWAVDRLFRQGLPTGSAMER